MILFKPEHVAAIREGRKTQTRRLGRRRWRVGSVHQCRTSYYAAPFAFVCVSAVYEQRLDQMRDLDVAAEGYDSWDEYMAALNRINRTARDGSETVWVVEFEVVS